MVISESSLHSRSRNYTNVPPYLSGQRTFVEVPASGRSSYYPHESAQYSTGGRGGGGGRSATYVQVLPVPSNGHRRYGSTTQLPSPHGYSSLSRRNSAIGVQNLVVPRAGSRFPSPVIGEFSHELSQRSPGIPPPCPDPPAQVDRGHLAAHIPSNYGGRARGARRSYYHSGQEQAFVEIAGAKRPSPLPIGMDTSCRQYSPSPILQRAKSYSDHPLTSAPEPSPRSFTFPPTSSAPYSNPVIIEPYTPGHPPPQVYYPRTTSSVASYAPPVPPPPSETYTATPSYPNQTTYSSFSTDTYPGSPSYTAEDQYAASLDCPSDTFSGTTAYDLHKAYDKQFSATYSTLPTIRTPQEEANTPVGSSSDSDTYCEVVSNAAIEFVEEDTKKFHVPTTPVDIQPASSSLVHATSTGTTGRYATTGKAKPAPVFIDTKTEKALVVTSSRRKHHTTMAAPGVKATHFDTSTLTPEETGDECSGHEDPNDNFSPSPATLSAYIPMNNLPTPPLENSKPDLSGGLTEQQLIGGSELLAKKCPQSVLFKDGADPLKIQYILVPARLSMISLVMAAAILEHLDAQFVEEIAYQCDQMKPQGVLCPNMIVVAALAIAQKYQSDKSYTTEFWKQELNHVNELYAPKGAKARPISRRMCATYEREILIKLDHRLLAIENDSERMNRIRMELEKYAQAVDETGFANAIGLGRYFTHSNRK